MAKSIDTFSNPRSAFMPSEMPMHAAFSARETFRIHLNDLGMKDAEPIPREEYDRLRARV